MNRALPIALLLASGVGLFHSASAADVPGAKDHPVVSRYTGSEILKYDAKEFDRYVVPLAPTLDGRKGPAQSQSIEGRVTRIHYRVPEGRAALEVSRNYEQSLRSAGFEVLYQCENQACGRGLSPALGAPQIMNFHDKDQKYLAARLSRAAGDVYVSVLTVAAYSVGGANKNRVFTQLDVIETVPMKTGLVTVDASAMAREIAATGKVALYGIYFDTGRADVRPDSKPALDEIAKLMKQDPALKLLVVGHTDTAGDFDFNIDLSRRRAQAVVQALVAEHRVPGSRLKPWGVGYAAPVASNVGEEGRRRNRRVELVAW